MKLRIDLEFNDADSLSGEVAEALVGIVDTTVAMAIENLQDTSRNEGIEDTAKIWGCEDLDDAELLELKVILDGVYTLKVETEA